MQIDWKIKPIKTRNGDSVKYEIQTLEAWVNDFRIGWINATFFYLPGQPDRNFCEASATSAVVKTRKLFAIYTGNQAEYDRIQQAALVDDYTEIKTWIEDQWTSMLTKAGIV